MPLQQRKAWEGGGDPSRSDSESSWGGERGWVSKNNNQAERVSDEAGHKYQDRHGEWRNDTVKDMTGLALIAWCKHKGVEYV